MYKKILALLLIISGFSLYAMGPSTSSVINTENTEVPICPVTLKDNAENIFVFAETSVDNILLSGSSRGFIRLLKYQQSSLKKISKFRASIFVQDVIQLGDHIVSASSHGIHVFQQKEGKYICIQTLTDHTDWVVSLLKIDNNTFISGSYDKSIKVYKKDSNGKWECVKTLEGHTQWVRSLVRITAKTFASSSNDKTVRIWEINNENITCIAILLDTEWVTSLVPINKTTLASGSKNGTIKIWQQNEQNIWRCIATLKGHSKEVTSLVKKDDNTFISGSQDGTIRIWHNRDGAWECLHTLKHSTQWITALLVKGNFLIVGCKDKTIKQYDLNQLLPPRRNEVENVQEFIQEDEIQEEQAHEESDHEEGGIEHSEVVNTTETENKFDIVDAIIEATIFCGCLMGWL